jgi:hypothetical protein
MFKWKKKNGEYVINRSWVMTEAWAIVNRLKKWAQQSRSAKR